jgi:hypothetical protein
MASEKQIAANRANAKRSTGPKTPAGKMASSRNAFRHGLSSPLQLNPIVARKVDAIIAHALASGEADQDRLASAADFARVQLELLRIRATRTQLTEKTEPNYNNTQELRRIAAFDRYERYCFTKRRRALNKIRCCEDDAHQEIAREGPE